MMRVSGVANSWQNFVQFCGKIWPLLKKFSPVEIFTFLKAFVLKNQTIREENFPISAEICLALNYLFYFCLIFFLSQILFLYCNEEEGMCRIYDQLGLLSPYCEGIKFIICYCIYIEVPVGN